MPDAKSRVEVFRKLHAPGAILVLPNAWDAGSARLIESAGATAIATTSAGLAWSRGYPDGDALPTSVLATAVAEIVRVVSVPLTVDVEGGYSDDPRSVGETVRELALAGAVGINLEDGSGSADLLCRKIAAVKDAAAKAGVDVFVNARTDVYLRGLVPPERALDEATGRARRYREAGCDGIFVPLLAEADTIRKIVVAVELPLNVMIVPNLPPVAELRRLGVRRVSAGSALTQIAYGAAKRAAARLLEAGTYEALAERGVDYVSMNALFTRR